MELTIFKNPIPVKAIPEEKLNEIIMGSFLDWISAILSLNEDATLKLEYALPAIKEHCWSMGFPEIKKMIEMYADGKLSVKPIPNHFDRIKFGEVANAYKQQKPNKTPKTTIMPEPTEEEKQKIIYHGLICCFDDFIQTEEIIDGRVWVHDHLTELNLLSFTDEEKKALWNLALKNLKATAKGLDHISAKEFIREVEKKNSTVRINEYKKLRLKYYFGKLRDKKEHLNKYL